MSTPRVDVPPGTRFGKLTVVDESTPRHRRNGAVERRVLVRCDCGEEYTVRLYNLRRDVGRQACRDCGGRG